MDFSETDTWEVGVKRCFWGKSEVSTVLRTFVNLCTDEDLAD